VVRIHHVNLHVPAEQLEAERDFLIEVLEFRPAPAPPELAGRVHWFDDDEGVQIHLSVVEERPPLDPGHVAVVVGERLQEVLRRASAEGHRTKGSGPIANCWDPAGNRWELRHE
jgi:catechol 2,3-dioxygenase-like lactoylglutathione lyase family enzyme